MLKSRLQSFYLDRVQGKISDVIERLQKTLSELGDPNARMTIDNYGEDFYVECYFTWESEETAKEKEQRIKYEERKKEEEARYKQRQKLAKQKKQENERKLYERLKKKYEEKS